ncbi:AT hook motif protein [Streptomyces phytohabitans]|uniref:AT hook motif protein n=2 Tax=Streptomyces TaxID=1883 RepID=UPI00269F5C5C
MTGRAEDGTGPDATARDADTGETADAPGDLEGASPGRRMSRQQKRKQVLLRLDPAVYEALARWAAAELRSTNAQIDYLLRRSLKDARRLPRDAAPPPRRGRPPRDGGGHD